MASLAIMSGTGGHADSGRRCLVFSVALRSPVATIGRSGLRTGPDHVDTREDRPRHHTRRYRREEARVDGRDDVDVVALSDVTGDPLLFARGQRHRHVALRYREEG